ncbi:MAG: hypothetical protein IJO10_08570 [Clostridia bacterium]|nr:hypothetical protein [Clostridia bacterium]
MVVALAASKKKEGACAQRSLPGVHTKYLAAVWWQNKSLPPISGASVLHRVRMIQRQVGKVTNIAVCESVLISHSKWSDKSCTVYHLRMYLSTEKHEKKLLFSENSGIAYG